MKNSTVLAAAMAMGLAFHAQAKTYTPVFTQSFDEAETFKENFVSGTVASEIFGTSDSSESAIPDAATHVQEQKSRYGATEDAKFYYYNRNEKSQGFSIIYKFPSSVTNLTDYKVEFDYYLSPLAGDDSRHSGLAIKGTQGIVATFDKQSGGGSGRRTDGCILVYGDNNSQTNTFSTGGRGTDPSNPDWAPYWLHVTVYGNETDGLFLSVEQANGTVVLSAVRVGAFQPIEKLFFYGKFTKSYGTGYIKSFSLDNVVVCSGTADAFAWTGNEGDNKWATPGNWTVDGEATTKYPEIGDAVSGLDATALAAMDIAVKLETTGDVTRFVNVCAKNVKSWTGGGADTLWTTLENWKYAIGDFAVYEAPADSDTVRFPASLPEDTEVSFNADATSSGVEMIVDGKVSFVSSGNTMRTVYPSSISGSGVLKLGDYIRIQTPTYAKISISCNLEIDGAASLRLRGNGAHFNVSGSLFGDGTVQLLGDSNPNEVFNFTGSFAEFQGTLDIVNSGSVTYNFNGDDSTIDFSSATVKLDNTATLHLGGTYTENTLKVGALTGAGTITNTTANALTLEIGRSGETDAESAVVLATKEGTGAWTVAKTGSNTQGLSDTTVAFNVSVEEGTLALPVGKELGTVEVSGGTLGFAADAAWEIGTAYDLFTYATWASPAESALTLDQSALAKICVPSYDFETAGTVKVTLSEAVFVWNGGTSGRWDDSANWTIDGETASAAPKGGEKVTIDGATVLIDTDTDISGVTLSNGAKLALGFTDDSLSYTIPEGRLASDFVVAGPYTMAESEGVLTATRTASTFVWNGGASGEWTDAVNWRVGGGYTAVVPGTGDTVLFNTANASVTLSSGATVAEIIVDAPTTFSIPYNSPLRTPMVRGEGVITVAEGFFAPLNASNSDCVISKDVVFAEGYDSAAYLAGADYQTVTIRGDISGSGKLTITEGSRRNAGIRFYGSSEGFSGSILVSCSNQYRRDETKFFTTNAVNANVAYAFWGDDNDDTFAAAEGESVKYWRLGSVDGCIYMTTTKAAGHTFEVGSLNTDFECGGKIGHKSSTGEWSYLNTVRKVGSGTFTSSINYAGTYEIAGGNLLLATNALPITALKFEGGTLVLTNAFKETELDIAAKIKGSSSAISIETNGDEFEFSSSLDSSNVGGLTKKGAGTLTLTGSLEYTGLTTVKEGTLYVPDGSDITYNPLSEGTLTGVTPTKYAYPAGTTLTGAESSKTFDGTLDVSNVTAIDVSGATLVKGQPYVIASATKVTGFTKDTIELKLPAGTDTAKWTVKIMSIDAKRSLCVAPPTNPFVVIVR